MLPTKFRFIWPSGFRDFLKSANQIQELPMATMFVNEFAHFVPIRYQTWPPQAILVSDCLISEKSSPLKPLSQMNRNLVESI
jgi:hypothetical protein